MSKISRIMYIFMMMCTFSTKIYAYTEHAIEVYETSISHVRVHVGQYEDSMSVITYLEGPNALEQEVFFLHELIASSREAEWYEDGFVHHHEKFTIYSNFDEQWIISK